MPGHPDEKHPSDYLEGRSHLPTLDSLRGFAIAAVLAYHFTTLLHANTTSLKWFGLLGSAGWCGVDAFFVLSGFLITRILLDSKHHSRPLVRFWRRRALRIFPLYYAFLIGCAALGVSITAPEKWLHHALYLSNWTTPFTGCSSEWLCHTWSLAIEEQFYLVWPILVLTLTPRTVARICIVGMLMALMLRVALLFQLFSIEPNQIVNLVYRASVTRMDALLGGSLVACLYALRSNWVTAKFLVPVAGIAVAVLGAVTATSRGLLWSSPVVQTIGYTALAVLFSTVVALAAAPESSAAARRLAGVLRSTRLSALGKYSYAMYLFHWPIVVTIGPHVRSIQEQYASLGRAAVVVASAVVGSAASFLLAWVSYHCFEKWFLRLK